MIHGAAFTVFVFCVVALIVTAGFGVDYPFDIFLTMGISTSVVLGVLHVTDRYSSSGEKK